MTGALEKPNALVAEVVDLRYAAALPGWDERVCMPPGGVPVHGHMLATIQRLASRSSRRESSAISLAPYLDYLYSKYAEW